MENYVLESKDERLSRRISKFRRDWEHYQYLIKKGLHPLEIVDRLNHAMFASMQIGLKNRHPDASNEEIRERMKQMVENDQKLKSLRGRKSHG